MGATIDNNSVVSARYGVATIQSLPSSQSIPVIGSEAAIAMTKTISRIEDTNGSGITDAGDTVFYEFTIKNTGVLTIEKSEISDPRIEYTGIIEDEIMPNGEMVAIEVQYVLTLEDFNNGGIENSAEVIATPAPRDDGTQRVPVSDISDAGDETLETAGLGGDTDLDPTNDPTVLVLDKLIDVTFSKTLVSMEQIYPYIYDLQFSLQLTNNSNLTLNDINISDDAISYFPDAEVEFEISPATFEFETDDGTKIATNPAYDGGRTDANLLETSVQLDPNNSINGTFEARVFFDRSAFLDGNALVRNRAEATATELDAPIATSSGDENILGNIYDQDNDGAPDNFETATAQGQLPGDLGAIKPAPTLPNDRDNDGIPNNLDYDPTGYFYCSETGEIMTGGRITINAETGNQSAVSIVTDGRDGAYQWSVTRPGTYEIEVTYPPGGVADETRPPAVPLLEFTSNAQRTLSLGSSEFGDEGSLSDATAEANPYTLKFVIGEAAPTVLNNNIPMRFCGQAQLALTKNVVGQPVILADGRTSLTYNFVLENLGSSRADQVQLDDDLAAVFGDANFEIASISLDRAPEDFTATIQSGFNGTTTTELLTSGGSLDPEQAVEIVMNVIVSPTKTGAFTNTATASAISPLDGSSLEATKASVDVALEANDLRSAIKITKTAQPTRIGAGGVVSYAIAVENLSPNAITGLSLQDLLPQGIIYRGDTAKVDGKSTEPTMRGERLVWSNIDLDAGQTRTATFAAVISSGIQPGDYTNQAWMFDPATNTRVSDIAEATIRVIAEAVFDCSDVLGKVFDDRNRNGKQDQVIFTRAEREDLTEAERLDIQKERGEPGLADIQISTATGMIITTDEFGRFSVPCAALPKASGSNFTLKLDERSLPSGYFVTTENPRTLRLTAGIFAEMNFGATEGRIVSIDLTAEAFAGNDQPRTTLINGLSALANQLGDDEALLRLRYILNGEARSTGSRRLDALKDQIEATWRQTGRPAPELELQVINK